MGATGKIVASAVSAGAVPDMVGGDGFEPPALSV